MRIINYYENPFLNITCGDYVLILLVVENKHFNQTMIIN